MPIYTLKLLEKNEVARHTMVFTFEKPNSFHFKPGQYGGFTLINPQETDKGGVTRRFSLLSTPDDNFLAIATRQQESAFKRQLFALPIGAEIKFAGPTGNFTLHEDYKTPVVLMAGGIGIAPFYSMIRFITHHQLQYEIYLFYGNTALADAAFLVELTELATQNPNFKLIATLDQPHDGWGGEQGFIRREMIEKYIDNIFTPIYYVCGAPRMVTAIQELLAEMGVEEENHIKVEDFPGY